MIVEFTDPAQAAAEFDVCVVGAGPAGIPLALRLSPDLRVLLVEGGGLEVSARSQDIYKGQNVGREYFGLDSTRLRLLGGSSNHWGGWCQALDEQDFLAKPHVPHSGWPIRKTDLDPYFDAAAGVLDLVVATPEDPEFRERLDAVYAGKMLDSYRFLFSNPPTRFGEKFRAALESAPNITVLYNANLTDIVLNEAGNAAIEVQITNYDGVQAQVPVRRVVLAAGGLENPRILLNCRKQLPTGIGNQNDLVGRFFGEHPQHTVGRMILEDDLRAMISAAFTPAQMQEWASWTFYSASPSFVLDQEITSFSLRFIPEAIDEDASFKDKVKNAVCNVDWISSGLDTAFKSGTPKCQEGRVHISTEQAPNPESRVTLSETERDAFGWARINLDWRMQPIDKKTIVVAASQFATLFAEGDLGRIRVPEWALTDELNFPGPTTEEAAGHHHMGTTRMADDPAAGVVDRDCRVHGAENIYIAGSSVFPTYGHTNPTFTIVQLALRLADHLNSLPA